VSSKFNFLLQKFKNQLPGDFNVDGVQFQWDDGVFSIALSRKKPNGFRTAFFHPLASYGEFTVSTEVLRNEELSQRQVHGNDFKFIGSRGVNSGTHFLDVNTNVIFYGEMQNNAVSCWRVKPEGIKRTEMGIVQKNDTTLIYPVDLEVRK
jgi:dopachrome tautomerase